MWAYGTVSLPTDFIYDRRMPGADDRDLVALQVAASTGSLIGCSTSRYSADGFN